MRDRLVKGRCGGAKVQLLKFINDSTRKQTHVGSWLQGKALSLARKKTKANQHKITVCPSIHMFHRIYWIITEERSPFQDQHFCSIFLGLEKVVMPLEKTRRTPNHPRMAHATANALPVTAAEAWTELHSPTHSVRHQTEVLHLASPCDIVIRGRAWISIQMWSSAVSQLRCAHQHCHYPEFCHLWKNPSTAIFRAFTI